MSGRRSFSGRTQYDDANVQESVGAGYRVLDCGLGFTAERKRSGSQLFCGTGLKENRFNCFIIRYFFRLKLSFSHCKKTEESLKMQQMTFAQVHSPKGCIIIYHGRCVFTCHLQKSILFPLAWSPPSDQMTRKAQSCNWARDDFCF